jgi:hypothetical protein
MNRLRLCAFLFAALCVSACAAGRAETKAVTGSRVRFGFEAGPSYQSRHGSGLFAITVRPQMAVWLETVDGKYVATIYVTSKGVRDAWVGAAQRPEALPVWRAASTGSSMPPLDGISGPTPEAGAQRDLSWPWFIQFGDYIAKLEVNKSYDYNDAYPEGDKKSGANGQPSLVYAGRIQIGKPGARVELAPVGTGSIDGADGTIRPGTGGLTSALEIVMHPFIEYLE